jgi:hypothetical protein
MQYESNGKSLPEEAPPLPIRVFLTPMHTEVLSTSTEEYTAPFCSPALTYGRSDKDNSSKMVDEEGTCVSFAGSRLAVQRIKIFTDGSLGAETAAIKVLVYRYSYQIRSYVVIVSETCEC